MVTPAEKKRTLEESRARARAYQASLKRKTAGTGGSPSSPSAENDGNPSSSKKPRTAATPKGKSKGKSARPNDERAKKAAKRLEARKRAQEFAKSLPNGKGKDKGAAEEGEGEGTPGESDDGSSEDEDMDAYMSDTEEPRPMPAPAKPSPSPVAPRPRPAGSLDSAAWPSRPTQGMTPAVPPMPATSTPTPIRRGRAIGRSTPQPLPNGNGSPSAPSVGMAGGRASFLRHASINSNTSTSTGTPAATTEEADPAPALWNDSRRSSDTSETTAGSAGPGHHSRAERQSFLDHARVAPPAPVAADGTANATPGAGNVGVNVAGQQEDGAPAAAQQHGVEARAQGRARIWALNCAVALAPVVFFFLVLGVLRAWPHVQVGAGQAWGTVRGFAARSPAADKCFLLPSERDANQALCKKGAEVADCPDQATCGGGSILACEFPLEKKMDGSACILTAEAKEEVNAVVEALRILTIEQLCKGNGFIMPSPKKFSTRSFITLTDAAAAQNRGPLSFLAGMPPGNVAGLIDLEGEAAPDFGGSGGDAVEGGSIVNIDKGCGSERIARLSEGAYNAVMLTPSWRCRARLAAGSWLLAYWPYCLGLYALVLMVGCFDLRRLKSFKRHVQVCTMRDEAYQALLNHAAKDSNPMQVSHIQISVGDKRRSRGEGSQAAIQKNVSKLWPLVEKEVEHDTRIRRNYKSVLGQRNVACWQWVGSAGTSFDSIGALDPGRAPRLWLLRWLN